jgi:Anti-sigma factor NepR
MREPADGLTPWDWSEAEVVLFAGPGQEVNPTVGRQGQRHITSELRAAYDDLVQQPLPERLLELVAKLDQN